jgi:hypothetical protein
VEQAVAVRAVSRETWIGVAVTAIAFAAMAVDHLLGTEPDDDDVGLVDPATFAISAGLSAAAAAVLFGRWCPV